MKITIKLIAKSLLNTGARWQFDQKNDQNQASERVLNTLDLANDINPCTQNLDGVQRINLQFPKFTDGRAYSQAFMLRRRIGFTGEIRATGDVLIDQLVQMQRAGFDAAELRDDQDVSLAQRQFDRFDSYYQGDAVNTRPAFASVAPAGTRP